MSAAVIAESSPRVKAMAAGFFWLISILTGSFTIVVSEVLAVSNDATATPANILAHELLLRLGFTGNVIAALCLLALTLLVYDVLEPVNRNLSLLAALCSLAGCVSGAVTFLCDLAPTVILGRAPYVSLFTSTQLQTLSLMFFRLRSQAAAIGLVFFGLHCLLIGYLILRSTKLPRVVGVLMVFAGLGWLTVSLAGFLSPPLGRSLSTFILVSGLIGEGSLALWLLAIGVKPHGWRWQASATAGWRSYLPSTPDPIARKEGHQILEHT